MTAAEKRAAALRHDEVVRNPETGKIIGKLFTLQQIEEAAEHYCGFCRACGAERDTCEPDARRYECEDCGMAQVYGAEELAIMGCVV